MTILYLCFGLVGLWVGAELIVKGALDIANHYRLSQAFIGLTILALGTDLPELFVNGTGGLEKRGGLETSNLIMSQIVGTGISQISLILGIAALVGAITITKKWLLRDAFMLISSVVFLILLSLDGNLSRIDGWILIVVYLVYLFSVLRTERVFRKFSFKVPPLSLFGAMVSMVGGFFVLAFAADLTVVHSINLSRQFGISEFMIGTFIIGLGTSLPELATAIAAIKNKASMMATGNIIGSNIFDLLFALGFGVVISGFSVDQKLLFLDIPILLIITGVVIWLLRTKEKLDKKEAILLISLYLFYFVVKLIIEIT